MTTSMGNPMCTVSPHNAQTNHHNLHQCIGAAPDAINPTRIWAASSTVSTSTGSLAPAVSGRAPPVCGLRPSEYHAAHVLGKVTSTIRLVPLSGQTSDHMPQQIDSSSTMGPSGGDTGWPPPNSIITPTGSSFPAGPDRSPSCRYSAPPEYQPTQAFGNVVPITATLIPHSEQTNNHQLHQSIDVASDITSPTSILAAIPMTTLTGCQALAITNRSSLLRGFGPLGYQPVRFLGKVTSSTARWVPLSEQTRYHTIPQCEQTNHHKLQQSIDVASDTISPPSTSAACPTTTTSTGSQVPATTCRPPLFHGLGPQEHQLAQVRGKVTSTARLVPQREQVYDHTLQSDRSSTTGPSEYRPARPVRNVVPTSTARPGPVSLQLNGHNVRQGFDEAASFTSLTSTPAASSTITTSMGSPMAPASGRAPLSWHAAPSEGYWGHQLISSHSFLAQYPLAPPGRYSTAIRPTTRIPRLDWATDTTSLTSTPAACGTMTWTGLLCSVVQGHSSTTPLRPLARLPVLPDGNPTANTQAITCPSKVTGAPPPSHHCVTQYDRHRAPPLSLWWAPSQLRAGLSRMATWGHQAISSHTFLLTQCPPAPPGRNPIAIRLTTTSSSNVDQVASEGHCVLRQFAHSWCKAFCTRIRV
jgi:hypothetical protein